jgi:hypothetical protein
MRGWTGVIFCGAPTAQGMARDPEKWEPVFEKKLTRKTKTWSGVMIRRKIIPL